MQVGVLQVSRQLQWLTRISVAFRLSSLKIDMFPKTPLQLCGERYEHTVHMLEKYNIDPMADYDLLYQDK